MAFPRQLYELIQDFFPAPSMIGYGKKVCSVNWHTPYTPHLSHAYLPPHRS